VGAGPTGELRWFVQREPTLGQTRSYRANGIFGLAASADVRVVTFSPRVWWSLAADYWQAISLSSWDLRQNQPVSTTSWRVAGKARVHLRWRPSHEAPETVFEGGYARWAFDVSLPAAPDLESPTGDYQVLRVGLAQRIPFGRFALFAGAGVGAAFTAGPLGNRTVSKVPAAVDGTLGAAVSLSRHVEIRVVADANAFLFELVPPTHLRFAPARVTDAYGTYGAMLHVSY
jgi:hypothetical protein